MCKRALRGDVALSRSARWQGRQRVVGPALHDQRALAGSGEQLELYFGATSGDVFGSGDAGATWSTAATRLPPVFSVVAI